MISYRCAFIATALFVTSGIASAQAPIKIGVVLALTGPAASVGIPEKNSLLLMPKSIGGHRVEVIILDDATDTTKARKNAEKLVSEDHVDVMIAGATPISARAINPVAESSSTALVALAPAGKLGGWVFQVPFTEAQYAKTTADHMKASGIKTIAYIGYNDPYGESWATEIVKAVEARNIKVVANERFERTATSVTAQVLKIMVANPDAVMIGASAGPAVLPQATLVGRGFKGKFYQGAGAINDEFLRLGGKEVEGALFASSPLPALEELPASNSHKAAGMNLKSLYEAAYGKGTLTNFSAYAWDAAQVVTVAAQRVLATSAKPGTPEFRKAMRDALEQARDVKGVLGTVSFSPTDHLAYDGSSLIMITVRDHRFALTQ